MSQPITKAAQLRALMAGNNWRGAILLAAKFQDLGAEREAILAAREALLRPAFQRQLNRDPDALIAAGKAVLKRKYTDARI